jgi:Spy/CpxP family protein refolding chaperone
MIKEHKMESIKMKLNILLLAAGIIIFSTTGAKAEDDNFGLEGTPSEEIQVEEITIEEAAPAEKAEPVEETAPVEEKETEKSPENVSALVEKLNLSDEQLEKAKEISDAGRTEKERLVNEIAKLRQQVKELEAKNLQDFEAILTSEQNDVLQQILGSLKQNNEETSEKQPETPAEQSDKE